MSTRLLTGSEAAAYGAKLARIEVLAYYPITPAFPAMERLSKFIEDGELNARFVRVAGGCSAGRLEDMEVIAEVLRDKSVHPDVTFIITPASQAVSMAMDEKGISTVLRQSGLS